MWSCTHARAIPDSWSDRKDSYLQDEGSDSLMSSSGNPTGFGIFDLLTRVTPGSILILMTFGGVIIQSSSPILQNQTLSLFVFTLMSLVVGEAINYVGGLIYTPPTVFRRFLKEEGVEVGSGVFDTIRRETPTLSEGNSQVYTVTADNFWELFTRQFDISRDYNDARDIYQILLGYMEPKMSPRTRRKRIVHRFVNNTIIAIFSGAVFVIGIVALEWYSGDLGEITIVWNFIALIFGVFIVYFLTLAFGYQEHDYINNLLIEYYIARAETDDVEELSRRTVQQTLNKQVKSKNERSR